MRPSEKSRRIPRRVFVGALGALGAYVVADLGLKGPLSVLLKEALEARQTVTEKTTVTAPQTTSTLTSEQVFKGLRLVFPEPRKDRYDAVLESLEFLDENSNVISSGNIWSTVDREYRVSPTPENARFAKLKASSYPEHSYWEDVSFNEIESKARRMDAYLAGRKVDSAQIYARDETYYLRLKPETDSDRDGILDEHDPNPRIPEPKPVKPRDDLATMAVYLPSWGAKWPPSYSGRAYPKSETLTIGTELHPILGQRYPIDEAGTYDSGNPETVDWHIKWALEHGVNAFLIAWMPFSTNPSGAWNHKFEDGFLRANYGDRMNFAIMHITDPTWDYPGFQGYDYVNETTEMGKDYVRENYMDYPSYLRVGKKYFYMLFRIRKYAIVHSLDKFLDLVERIHDQDIFLVGDIGCDPYPHDRRVDEDIVRAFDAVTAYNWNWAGSSMHKGKRDGRDVWTLVAPYSSLVSGYYEEWRYWYELTRDCGVGFVTPLCAGFSNRATYDAKEDDWLVERTGRTPELFKKMCKESVPFIEKSRTNVCLIDGWNEIHESSTLEPMVEHGFDYLDVVRDVFCIEPSDGWPLNVVPTKEGVREYSGQ